MAHPEKETAFRRRAGSGIPQGLRGLGGRLRRTGFEPRDGPSQPEQGAHKNCGHRDTHGNGDAKPDHATPRNRRTDCRQASTICAGVRSDANSSVKSRARW